MPTPTLRVTVDAAFKAELDELRALLSHKVPSGDLAAVLREAVRCAREKYGKRKGTVAPARKAPAPKSVTAPGRSIPAEVRREVWRRDGSQCAWRAPDGRRCESRWQLELDHVHPVALGGPSTVENLRVLCAIHNQLHAEQVFGREHMEQFRGTRTGENASPGDSSGHQSGAPWVVEAPSRPRTATSSPPRTM